MTQWSALHARRTELACDEIEKLGVPLREGVDNLLVRVKKSGPGIFHNNVSPKY